MFNEIRSRVIDYYVDGHGREPFREWLDALKDVVARSQIRSRLDRAKLENFGNCRSVGEGVMELKVDFGPGYRIYFGLAQNQVILLLCGGDKSSQGKDIQRAKEYLMDYRRRSHAHKI